MPPELPFLLPSRVALPAAKIDYHHGAENECFGGPIIARGSSLSF
jgi:hypothetical protein